jgi:hypothetical protein
MVLGHRCYRGPKADARCCAGRLIVTVFSGLPEHEGHLFMYVHAWACNRDLAGGRRPTASRQGPAARLFFFEVRPAPATRRILLSMSIRLCRVVAAKMIILVRASVCVWGASSGTTHFFTCFFSSSPFKH